MSRVAGRFGWNVLANGRGAWVLLPLAIAVAIGACGGGDGTNEASGAPAGTSPGLDGDGAAASGEGGGDDAGDASDASKKDSGKPKDGGPGDGSSDADLDDGDVSDGSNDGGSDGSSASDGSSSDGSISDGSSGTDGASGDGGQVVLGPLPSCTGAATSYGPLPTGVNLPIYGSYEPGPLMLFDTRAFVFVEGSGQWTVASLGSATTTVVPGALTGASSLTAWPSLSGRTVITFTRASKVWGILYDGASFGSPIELPCTASGSACEARAAGDGHLWVLTQNNFHEQDGAAFTNRGGGPGGTRRWDVDAAGTVVVLGGPYSATEYVQIWKLVVGAGGWAKTGALEKSAVTAVAATIEGGFQLSAETGALAPDGSIHLLSDPRCVGTGERNKTQVYLRSHDGTSWDITTLPAADTMHGQVTWKHGAIWAGSYDHVRYVVTSSPKPYLYDGTWIYPDRRQDLVARCTAAGGGTSFARVGNAPHPGWTDRGFAGISRTGVTTLLTKSGLTQLK